MLVGDNMQDQFKSYTKPLHSAGNANSVVLPHSSPLEALRGRDVCNSASKILWRLRIFFRNLVIGRLCNLILLAFALCAFDVRRTQPLIFWIPVELLLSYSGVAFSTFFFVVRLHFWRLNFVIGTCPSLLFDQEQPDGATRHFSKPRSYLI